MCCVYMRCEMGQMNLEGPTGAKRFASAFWVCIQKDETCHGGDKGAVTEEGED